MGKVEVGKIYIIFNEEKGDYLHGEFNWYVDLNDEERARVNEGLLQIQDALFDSVVRVDKELSEEENKEEE